MSTGYTLIIREKQNVTFREYALGCSQAFDDLIEMCDDSLDTQMQYEFHPRDYHSNELKRAQETLQKAKNMTLEEATREAERDYKSALRSHNKAQQSNADLHGRYEAMLQKARNYQSPTKDHDNFKKFMVDQLEESLKFDCSYSKVKAPQKQTPKQYQAQLIKQAKHDVAYHQKEWKEEVKHARKRTKWVQALMRSLPKE